MWCLVSFGSFRNVILYGVARDWFASFRINSDKHWFDQVFCLELSALGFPSLCWVFLLDIHAPHGSNLPDPVDWIKHTLSHWQTFLAFSSVNIKLSLFDISEVLLHVASISILHSLLIWWSDLYITKVCSWTSDCVRITKEFSWLGCAFLGEKQAPFPNSGWKLSLKNLLNCWKPTTL